jgi:hypothetical protein
MAGPRLGTLGAQYDELHQAAGAFAWLGEDVPFFVTARAFGLPVLNMSYSGAIKTALYGLHLRLFRAPFTIESWRLLGIAFVALGLFCLCLMAWRSSRLMTGTLIALLLSDAGVLLQARYDGGPTALGMLLRLLLVGVWLHGSAVASPSPGHAFSMGLLTGLAAFEKLNSAVLMIPLAILMASDARFRERSRLACCAAGLLVGLSPLIALNLGSWLAEGALVSLRHATASILPSLDHLEKVWGYLSLGAGGAAARFSLGLGVPVVCEFVEGVTVAAAAVCCLLGGKAEGPLDRRPRMGVACWLGVGLGLACLPSDEVLSHHWIVGTPSQYAAIALALAQPARLTAAGWRARGTALKAVVAILLANRLVVMSVVLSGIVSGRASREFDPELNRLGAFAARQAPDVTFVAATWGVGTQIYCFSNGRAGVVSEPFWSYSGPEDLERVVEGRRVFYVVSTDPISDVSPTTSRRIMADAGTLGGWKAAPLEAEAGTFRTVHLAKYVRTIPTAP